MIAETETVNGIETEIEIETATEATEELLTTSTTIHTKTATETETTKRLHTRPVNDHIARDETETVTTETTEIETTADIPLVTIDHETIPETTATTVTHITLSARVVTVIETTETTVETTLETAETLPTILQTPCQEPTPTTFLTALLHLQPTSLAKAYFLPNPKQPHEQGPATKSACLFHPRTMTTKVPPPPPNCAVAITTIVDAPILPLHLARPKLPEKATSSLPSLAPRL